MLVPHLLKGAALSPFKRPGPDRALPAARDMEPGLRIERRRLTRYAELCGCPASAVAGDTVPVTYPHLLGFPATMRLMSAWDFPLPVLGLVHTMIGIRQLRALSPDETYELTVHAAELTPHRRGTEAQMVIEVRAAGGELVWESRSSYLARHATGPTGADGPTSADGPTGAKVNGTPADETARALPVQADWRLGGDLGRRYGAVSRDRNPIHLYPLTARLFGFPRAIVHGMWTVARCVSEHSAQGAAYDARGPVTVHAEFRKPVLLPSTVRYAAEGDRFAVRGGRDGSRVHLVGEVRQTA